MLMIGYCCPPIVQAVDLIASPSPIDLFLKRPLADEVDVHITPVHHTCVLGEELLAVIQIQNVSTRMIGLFWQQSGEEPLNADCHFYHVFALTLLVDAATAANHGIAYKIPLYGGISGLTRLSPEQTKRFGIRLDDYLDFSHPVDVPITVRWTLALSPGQTKSGEFSLRVTAPNDPLDEFLRQAEDRRLRHELRPELEPFWEPTH
jgi:hypothetical protein